MSSKKYYDLLKHSENTYNNRNNYFIVFHSITLAATASIIISSKFTSLIYFTYLIEGVSLIFTLIWLIVNIKSFKRIGEIKDAVKGKWYTNLSSKKNIPINFLTGILIPIIIIIFWMGIFILTIDLKIHVV